MSHGPALIFALLLLVLPIAALVARRPPARQLVWMTGTWVAIFAVLGSITILGFT